MTVHWSGWALDDRAALLDRLAVAGAPLRHPVIVCDHVTRAYPDTTRPAPTRIAIVGIAADEHIQALVAEVDGTTRRADGEIYHVTLTRTDTARDSWSKDMLRSTQHQPLARLDLATTPILRAAGG